MIESLYIIFYIMALFSILFTISHTIKDWKNPDRFLKINNTSLETLDIYNIFKTAKNKLDNKKSVFLIDLAKKGFIKIRKDESNKIFVDKIRDFEGLSDSARSIITEVFSDNVTYHGDENAIMSYETVAWDDAKERYRNIIDRVFANKANVDDSNIDVKIKKKPSLRGRLVLMWVICFLPISLTYWHSNYSMVEDIIIEMFAIYFFVGLSYVFVAAALKIIKVLREFGSRISELFKNLFLAVCMHIGVIILIGLLCIFIMNIGVVMIALFAISSEWSSAFPLNALLEVVMIAVTAILSFIGFKKKKELELKIKEHSESFSALYKKNLRKTIKTQQDYNNALLYAYIFNKVDVLNSVADSSMKFQPEWYEGENWESTEQLMLQLDKK